jgi:DNA-binding XRE family transcriptional regulator
MLTPDLVRAARAFLDWTQTDLAVRANLSLSSIRDFEVGTRPLSKNNLTGVQLALESEGIVFQNDLNGNITLGRVPKGTNSVIVADPGWPAGVRRI